jgi:hypothetical protein
MCARPSILTCLAGVIVVAGSALAPGAETGESQPNSSEAVLAIGDTCTVKTERHGARQQFNGELIKLNDRWLVLRRASGNASDRHASVWSKIFFAGAKNDPAKDLTTYEYLWIPRDAATIEKKTPASGPPNVPATMGEAPPVQVYCAVELAVGGRVARHSGGMEALSDDKLTLSVSKQVSVDVRVPPIGLPFAMDTFGKKRIEKHYAREQLPLGDILCIHVPDYDPAALTARAH